MTNEHRFVFMSICYFGKLLVPPTQVWSFRTIDVVGQVTFLDFNVIIVED